MGNEIANENNQASTLLSQLQFIKKFKDVHYGDVTLMCDPTTRETYAVKEKQLNSKEEFERELESFTSRQNVSHPNLVDVIGITSRSDDALCGAFHKITAILEYIEGDLEREILARVQARRPFTEDELWYMLQSIVGVLAFLQRKAIFHGDIRPTNILISSKSKGAFKILDSIFLSADGPSSNFAKIIFGTEGYVPYLSPKLLQAIGYKDLQPTHNPFKSDVFSLGMTMLYAATLVSNDSCYQWATFSINVHEVSNRLNQLSTRHSSTFLSALQELLELDEERRPDAISLEEKLNYLQRESERLGKFRQGPAPIQHIPQQNPYQQQSQPHGQGYQQPSTTSQQYGYLPAPGGMPQSGPIQVSPRQPYQPTMPMTTGMTTGIGTLHENQHPGKTSLYPGFENPNAQSQPLGAPGLPHAYNPTLASPQASTQYSPGVLPQQPSPAYTTTPTKAETKIISGLDAPASIGKLDGKFAARRIIHPDGREEFIINEDYVKQNGIPTDILQKLSKSNQISATPPQVTTSTQIQGAGTGPRVQPSQPNVGVSPFPGQTHVPSGTSPINRTDPIIPPPTQQFTQPPTQQFTQPAIHATQTQSIHIPESNKLITVQQNFDSTSPISGAQQGRVQAPVAQQPPQVQPQTNMYAPPPPIQAQPNPAPPNYNMTPSDPEILELMKKYAGNQSLPPRPESIAPAMASITIEKYQDGSWYEGEKKNNLRHGHGKYYYGDGGYYDGAWENDSMTGFGKLYYQDGKLAYEGEWAGDHFNGRGKMYNDSAQVITQPLNYKDLDSVQDYWVNYEGQLRNDNKDGQGVMTFSNGEKFQGEYKEDKANGRGTYFTLDGQAIDGKWEENKLVALYVKK